MKKSSNKFCPFVCQLTHMHKKKNEQNFFTLKLCFSATAFETLSDDKMICVRACFCEVKFKSLLAKAEEKKCGEQHTTTKNWTKEMKKGRNNKLTFEQQSKRKVCSFPAAC